MSDAPYDTFTIDGWSSMRLEEARKLARRLFFAGFLLLPWLWAANAWLFWPHARGTAEGGVDPQLRSCAAALLPCSSSS